MNKATRFKLFLMMVLELLVWGAWLPLINSYMQFLHFDDWQRTWVNNAFAIASITAMFFSNQFADRNFAAEKFMAVSHLLGGVAVLAIFVFQRVRGGPPEQVVSVTYPDVEWKGAVRPGDAIAGQSAVLEPPSWLDVLLSSSVPKGRATPFQLAYTSGRTLLIAHRDSGGGLSDVERHDADAVQIEEVTPERAGSLFVSVQIRVHGKRRSFVRVPAAFFSELRRNLGR